MTERTALGEKILKHWREHCPQMVRDLESMNRLDQAVFEAQERTGDLLYELTVVKKMDYQAAWEMASEEWAMPPGSESPQEERSPSEPPKSSSTEPAPPVPARDFRISGSAPDRAGRAEGKGPRQHRGHPHPQTHRRRKPRQPRRPKRRCSRAIAAGARSPTFSIPIRRSDWAGHRGRSPATPDRRGIRFGAGLDAERAFHVADGDRGHVDRPCSGWGLASGAQILEPSMGVGHFFGLMPEALLPGCRRTGVELDNITARIAQQLYPDATIFAKGFEETAAARQFLRRGDRQHPVRQLRCPRSRLRKISGDAGDPRLLSREVARQAAAGRRDGADHQPLHDGQAGFDHPAASGGARRSGRRHPAAEHGLQGQCRHGSHDRHPVPAEARARSRRQEGKPGGS